MENSCSNVRQERARKRTDAEGLCGGESGGLNSLRGGDVREVPQVGDALVPAIDRSIYQERSIKRDLSREIYQSPACIYKADSIYTYMLATDPAKVSVPVSTALPQILPSSGPITSTSISVITSDLSDTEETNIKF